MSEAQQDKSELRQLITSRLKALTNQVRLDGAQAACTRAISTDAFTGAKTIMAYMPFGTELDVLPLGVAALAEGKRLCVPLVDWEARTMTPASVDSLAETNFSHDAHGIRTPLQCEPVAIETIDLIVTPGLAYDETGARLGRGGGYYDRFLPLLRADALRMGVAFEVQMIEQVPARGHDERVDLIATERRTITTSR